MFLWWWYSAHFKNQMRWFFKAEAEFYVFFCIAKFLLNFLLAKMFFVTPVWTLPFILLCKFDEIYKKFSFYHKNLSLSPPWSTPITLIIIIIAAAAQQSSFRNNNTQAGKEREIFSNRSDSNIPTTYNLWSLMVS